jgi:hypothetical protein
LADQKISDLAAASALTGTELVELVQGGVNKRTTTQDIADLGAGGGGTVTSVSGTTDRITSTGGATPVIDISATFEALLEKVANKGASGGYVGMSGFSIAFKNLANTFTSLIQNAATAVRTYTFQNRDGTIADDTDLALKQALVNTAVAITDAASMDLTAIKHTLTTSSATRTFTISYTGDDISMKVILNATSSVFTFPASALCINSDGAASGNNTCSLAGVSGDVYVFAVKHWGSSVYTVVCRNTGQ